MPLADVMQECGPGQVRPERLEPGHIPGGIQTVPLVVSGLFEEYFTLEGGEPSANLIDLSRPQSFREDHREEPGGEMAPRPEGRSRRRPQESFTLQSTQ